MSTRSYNITFYTLQNVNPYLIACLALQRAIAYAFDEFFRVDELHDLSLHFYSRYSWYYEAKAISIAEEMRDRPRKPYVQEVDPHTLAQLVFGRQYETDIADKAFSLVHRRLLGKEPLTAKNSYRQKQVFTEIKTHCFDEDIRHL